MAEKIPLYLKELKPKTYLFEGLTPDEPMGERSTQYIVNEEVPKKHPSRKISPCTPCAIAYRGVHPMVGVRATIK